MRTVSPRLSLLAGSFLLLQAAAPAFAQDAGAVPRLLSAQNTSGKTIALTFSAPVVLTQLQTIGAFRVTGSSGPVSVKVIHLLDTSVTLDTSGLTAGESYTVHAQLPVASGTSEDQTTSFIAAAFAEEPAAQSAPPAEPEPTPAAPEPAPPAAEPAPPAEEEHPAAPVPPVLAQSGAGILAILAASGAYAGWRRERKKRM